MYETIGEMAERLGVSKRTIQIWARDDKIPGAIKQGKMWLIPKNSEVVTNESVPAADKANAHLRLPMPLLNMSYVPGKCKEYVDNMKDNESRFFARAEYYFGIGDAERACEEIEKYSQEHGYEFKPAASVIYSFANLAMGNIQFAMMGIMTIKDEIEKQSDVNIQEKAMQVFVDTLSNNIFNLPESKEKLSDYIHLLPKGVRILACYVLALGMIRKKQYERAIGTVELATMVNQVDYPLPVMYCHLICAVGYMALKNVKEAEKCFMKAWEIAYADKLFEAIGEHHAMLCGLVEKCIKNDYPEEYEKVLSIAKRFGEGSGRLRAKMNNEEEYDLPQQLTSTEMVIATLACREWSNDEIADHIHLSVHTVKYYLSLIYQKLGISKRKELIAYMEL